MSKEQKPSDYYKGTNRREAQLHRLVTLRLRYTITQNAYYNKGQDIDGYGLFDIVDPSEEADLMLEDLRLFGFLPEAEPAQEGVRK